MKTDELIRALSTDRARTGLPPAAALALSALFGIACSVALFLWLVPVRPHLAEAAQSFRFLLKPVEMTVLVVTASIAVVRLTRPGVAIGKIFWVAALVPFVMLTALIHELLTVSRLQWLDRLAGEHWYMCVVNMVILSLPILAALLVGLRYGAPTQPSFAGAGAGLLSGALAASIYITHCPDDSPLFVAAWFTLAILISTAIGALLGRHVLRW